MAKIILSIEDIEIGYLLQRGEKYLFCANQDGIVRAKDEFPIEMALFKLNESGMIVYDSIPFPFNTFLSGAYREDLMKKAGIVDEDDDFQRLAKLSKLTLMRENFDIHFAS